MREKARKRARILLLAAGWITSVSVNAFGTDIKIIANSSVKTNTISAAEIKRVFLEESNSLEDGSHVEPVLERDGPVHQAFLQEYMGRTDADLQTFYRALVFTGKGSMPKKLSSDAEVVAYVARARGAIGYVSAETGTEGLKTLTIVEARSEVRRRLITRVEPQYPETLKRMGIGGIVRVRVTIAPKGNVENVELLGGNPILGDSAMVAVKQWIYATSHSRTLTEITIPFDARR